VQIRDPETNRLLLVTVACRGRLVAQQFTVATAAGKTVRLTPTPGARGVLRLTVYDASEKVLRPLAERLLFCNPAATLELNATCRSASTENALKGGDLVDLHIQTPKAKDATVLAAVLEETLANNEANLGISNPAPHFFLATELEQPEDLEDAEVLLGEAPEASQALDLFLGTQGWRRFVHPTSSAALTLLAVDNRARIQAASQEALQRQRQHLWEEMEQERTALKQERQQRAAAAQDAAVALAAYQDLPRQYGRLAALVGLVTLFGLFVLGVVVVLVQTVRGLPTPRTLLGGSVLALVCCGVTFVLTSDLRMGQHAAEPQVAQALLKPEWRTLPAPEVAALSRLAAANKTNVEMLALISDELASKVERSKSAGDAKVVKGERQELLRERNLMTMYGAGMGGQLKDLQKVPQPSALALIALEKSKEVAPEPKKADVSKVTESAAPLRGYAFQGKGATAEVLLWQPDVMLTNGSAAVRFTLPSTPGSYRVLLYGNTADGRLGFSQSRLATKK